MPARHYYTAADLLAMPEDGNKYEVVHGELLVTPAPRLAHQLVLSRLIDRLSPYLARHPVGQWLPGGDLSWSSDSLVVPDLFVVDRSEAKATSWEEVKTLLLVVEILSPSTTRNDRFTKRRLYQEVGIPLYWLVDADAQVVEVWTPDAQFPVTEQEEIRWHPAGAAEPLVIRLGELFREV
ncbi:MAG: Uma2 family endonuclease [Gemmatimonadales bacterium]